MKISIIIPTRNRPELLTNAIRSVIDQEYSNFELIIADNSSNLDSQNVLARIQDERIRYFPSMTTLNVTDNWNRAITYATGDYILMLGDDDALVPNGLSQLTQNLASYSEVDCAYVGCYLLSFPNAFPGQPEGFLRSYRNRSIYQGSKDSFILGNHMKGELVAESMNFVVSFDYNPQFWVMSRAFLHSNFSQVKLYKSPYPDYYAAIALMHLSKKILIIPDEIVIIGITKQSHGYMHFSGDDSSANIFLTLDQPDPLLGRIAKRLIPGNFMTNMWAISLEYLRLDYSLPVNWDRYRTIQMKFVEIAILESRKINFKVFSSLKFFEKIRILGLLLKSTDWSVETKAQAIFALQSKMDTHPFFEMENLNINSIEFAPIYKRFSNLMPNAN